MSVLAPPRKPATDGLDGIRGLVRAAAGRPVRTVAAVGNAPLGSDAGRAAAIDAADVVLRVNGFALDRSGADPVVGTRTTAVVFNRGIRATPWLFDRYRERVYLLVEPGRMTWEPAVIPGWWPHDLGPHPVPNREVTDRLAAALGLDPRAENGQWATTGTYSAWLGRMLFPEARLLLTGFSFVTDRHQDAWAHAYGEPCQVGPEHRIDREGALLTSWAREGKAEILP